MGLIDTWTWVSHLLIPLRSNDAKSSSPNDQVFYATTLQNVVWQGLFWTITMRNYVYLNHTTLQLEFKK
jgi:hypothetical protein